MFFGHIYLKLNYLATRTEGMFSLNQNSRKWILLINYEAWRERCKGLGLLCCRRTWLVHHNIILQESYCVLDGSWVMAQTLISLICCWLTWNMQYMKETPKTSRGWKWEVGQTSSDWFWSLLGSYKSPTEVISAKISNTSQ